MRQAQKAIIYIAFRNTSDGCSGGSVENVARQARGLGRFCLRRPDRAVVPDLLRGYCGRRTLACPCSIPVALRHANAFQLADVALPPHAPHVLAHPVRTMPPLRPGKPVRDGEWPSAGAMLVHAGGDQPFSIAGAARRGTRDRLYLPCLCSAGAARSTQRVQLSADIIDPFFSKETEYADVPH